MLKEISSQFDFSDALKIIIYDKGKMHFKIKTQHNSKTLFNNY